MMKRWVRCLCVILLMAVVVGITVAAASEPQAQAANGLVLEDMTIVIPIQATSVEQSAAIELRAYLKKIAGKTVTITRENNPVVSAIYIGDTDFAAANNVTYTDKNGYGEGWAIKTIGKNVVLTGGEVRGSLYAVWHLLEDVLGVRWWNMWEEYVPTMTDAVIPFDYDVKGEPAFGLRDIYLNAENTKHLFLARNRCNGFTTNASKAYGGEENYGRHAHSHTFSRYFPPYGGEEYFANHPEWYSWSDEKQARISYGQLCLTNEELIQEFTAKVLDVIYGDFRDHDAVGLARPRFFSIDPNDIGGFCECDVCEADIAKRGLSGYLIHFVNLIAEEVEKIYPTAILKTSAYAYTLAVPLDDTVPRANVMLQLADSEMDVMQDVYHPNNAEVLERIRDWAKICDQCDLEYWEYGVTYRENGIMPSVFRYQSFLQELLENGFFGHFIEMQRCNNTDFWDLKVWVLTKLMEDPYLDLETVIMDFLTGYYGEAAADDLYNYLVFMQSKVESYDQVQTFAADILPAQWLTAADVLAGHNYFEKATKELMGDSSITEEQRTYYLKHLHSARGGLDRVILANYDRYCEEMARQNALFDVDKRAVGTRMVAGLDFLTSMTLSSDHTGYQQVETRAVYDGTGKYMMDSYSHYAAELSPNLGLMKEKPALPAQVLADHPGVNEKHVYDYTANNYWIGDAGFPFVTLEEDAASYTGGPAIKVSCSGVNSYFDSTGETDKKAAYTITEANGLAGNLPQSLKLGAPLVADGQYHLYRMEDVVLYETSSIVTLFSSDAVNVNIGMLRHLKNKPVDVYLSMKIVGDPTGTNASNYATYYIDRLIVVENCDESDFVVSSVLSATCTSNEIKIAMCRVCGVEIRHEMSGTKLFHDITDGYTYHADQKCYTANCTRCGEVTYDVLGEYPEEIMDVANSSRDGLNRILEYGVEQFTLTCGGDYAAYKVSDPASQVGQAVRWEYATLPAYKEFFEFSDTKAMNISGCGGISTKIYGSDMIVDGKYHTYHLKDVPLVGDFECIMNFFDWSMRVDFSDLGHLYDRTVDVYFTMKIDGELNYTDPAKYPTYYIDRVFVVQPCTDHIPGTDYVYNHDTMQYEAGCRICGDRVPITNVRAELPEELMNEILDSGIGLQHVYDYNVDNFNLDVDVKRQEDPESVFGAAAVLDTNKASVYSPLTYLVTPDKPMVFEGYREGELYELGRITYEQMSGNVGKGYQFYKFEDIVLVKESFITPLAWEWGLQNHIMAADLKKLQDKPVDLYISLKAEGLIGYRPIYYLDRMIVVDNCANHVSDMDYLPEGDVVCGTVGSNSAACPVCGKRFVKENVPMTHSFTEYLAAGNGATEYVAVCDNGCGATDVKVDPGYKKDEMLPEGLSEHARRHIIQVYRVKDFRVEVEGRLQWDLDINRPVAQRSYDRTQEATARDSLNMSIAGGISACMYSHQGTLHGFPGIKGEELAENSGKGYVLYENKGVIPIQDPSYYYFFMFGDWGLQIQYLDDDLMLGYRNTPVDIYYHVKVEGNPYCNGGPNPEYYIDQVIVTESCDGGDDCIGKPLTVRFNANGGSAAATQTVFYGQKAAQPVDPTRDGYAFKGWYYGNEVFDFETPVMADMTLKAVWEKLPTHVLGKAVAKGYSLSLEGVVFMNVYFTVEGYTASNAADIRENVGMYVWDKTDYTGDPLTSELALADKCPATARVWNSSNSEYRYMAQTDGIVAAKLGDELVMVPYAEIDGVTYLAEKPVDKSPRVYAESNIPKASTDDAIKNVLISLMNYGAAAQQYFGDKTDSLMNDFLKADQQLLGLDSVDYTPKLEVDTAKVDAAMTSSELVTSRAASLSLEGAINVNYYFKYNGTAVDAKLLFWKQETYTADGAVLTKANADLTVDLEQLADGSYYGDYKNIPAAHMGKTLFCCAVFTNAAGKTAYSGVISYSPMYYAYNSQANDNTALATMMQYMAVYGNYANIKWPD